MILLWKKVLIEDDKILVVNKNLLVELFEVSDIEIVSKANFPNCLGNLIAEAAPQKYSNDSRKKLHL
jgi:hypothetical protein